MHKAGKISYHLVLAGQLALLILTSLDCTAIDCNDPRLQSSLNRLQEYNDQYQPEKAILLADSMLIQMQHDDWSQCKLYFRVKFQKGAGLELLYKFDDALEIYYNMLSDIESLAYWDVLAETYLSISRIDETIERPENCKKSLGLARQLILSKKVEQSYSRYAVRYSSYHRIYGNRDSARIYALEAIKFGNKHDVLKSEIDGNLLMGMLTENLDDAMAYFKNAIHLFLRQKNYHGAAAQSLNIARRLIELGRYKEANIQIDTAIMYINKMTSQGKGYFYLLHRAYDIKNKIYLGEKRIDSAYHYLELSQNYWKKSNSIVEQEKINDIEQNFLLDKEKNKMIAIQKEAKLLRIGLSIGILILLLLGGLLFMISSNRKKLAHQNKIINDTNKSLEESLKVHSTLLIEIHHRVKNNLQTILSLLELYRQKIQNHEFNHYLQNISDKIYSIALIHEHIYRKEIFEKINMQDYLNDLFMHLRSISIIPNDYNFEVITNEIHFNIETAVPIGIICTELITNSIKYAQVENNILKISLNLSKNNNKYNLVYSDNGPGFKDGKFQATNMSMGNIVIKNMVRQLNGVMETYNDVGATVIISFAEKEVSTL